MNKQYGIPFSMEKIAANVGKSWSHTGMVTDKQFIS